MLSRQRRLRPSTTVVRLYSIGNHFWGYVVAWGVLLAAALLLGKDSLTGPDPNSARGLAMGTVAAFGLSLGSLMCLGRPYVDIDAGMAIVRNPLRVTRVPLGSVVRVDRTFGGWVTLHTTRAPVVLWGMQQPLKEAMLGYTEDVSVLLAEIAACGGVGELADGPDRPARAIAYAARSAALVSAERTVGPQREPVMAGSSWKPFSRGLFLLLVGWAVHLTLTLPAIATGA